MAMWQSIVSNQHGIVLFINNSETKYIIFLIIIFSLCIQSNATHSMAGILMLALITYILFIPII